MRMFEICEKNMQKKSNNCKKTRFSLIKRKVLYEKN